MKHKTLAIALLIGSWSHAYGEPEPAATISKPIFDMEQKYWRVTKAVPPKVIPSVDGCVLIKYDIDAKGTTNNLTVVAAHPKNIYDKASIAALKKYKFKPTEFNKEKTPVSSLTMSTFVVSKGANNTTVAEECYRILDSRSE